MAAAAFRDSPQSLAGHPGGGLRRQQRPDPRPAVRIWLPSSWPLPHRYALRVDFCECWWLHTRSEGRIAFALLAPANAAQDLICNRHCSLHSTLKDSVQWKSIREQHGSTAQPCSGYLTLTACPFWRTLSILDQASFIGKRLEFPSILITELGSLQAIDCDAGAPYLPLLKEFQDLFPGVSPTPLVASVCFHTPVVRDLCSWCGVRQVRERSVR